MMTRPDRAWMASRRWENRRSVPPTWTSAVIAHLPRKERVDAAKSVSCCTPSPAGHSENAVAVTLLSYVFGIVASSLLIPLAAGSAPGRGRSRVPLRVGIFLGRARSGSLSIIAPPPRFSRSSRSEGGAEPEWEARINGVSDQFNELKRRRRSAWPRSGSAEP